MRALKYVSVTLAVAFVAAFSTYAQTNPGNIGAFETQTPKPGMNQQYKQGRKQTAIHELVQRMEDLVEGVLRSAIPGANLSICAWQTS